MRWGDHDKYKVAFLMASVILLAVLITFFSDKSIKEILVTVMAYIYSAYLIYGFVFGRPIEIPGASITRDDPLVLRVALLCSGIVGLVLVIFLTVR